VYSERTIRARKAHKCSACKATIRRGDYHARVEALCDGRWERVRRCGRCQATYKHLFKIGQRDGMQPDWSLNCGMRYEDEWGPVPDEIARLPFLTDDEASALLEAKP
jgi:hypothetical protein